MQTLKIKSIKKVNIRDRYDLCVNSTHNFFANGILIHNSSAVIGNVKVKKPRWNGLYAKVFNYLPSWLQFTVNDYDVVYSSRKVIKNSEYNTGTRHDFYGVDIWEKYYLILKDAIPEGMTIYGEIAGYVDGTAKGIQSLKSVVYDYGAAVGDNKLMIYRIKQITEDGGIKEYNVKEVYDYTVDVIIPALKAYDKLNGSDYASHIMPIDILYDGTLKDLYPDIDVENHWHENVLEALKNEKRFHMEKNEPLCKNKLPREGIVVRINDDPLAEAFKLKCIAFLSKEAEDMDKGITSDIEMQERYN